MSRKKEPAVHYKDKTQKKTRYMYTKLELPPERKIKKNLHILKRRSLEK